MKYDVSWHGLPIAIRSSLKQNLFMATRTCARSPCQQHQLLSYPVTRENRAWAISWNSQLGQWKQPRRIALKQQASSNFEEAAHWLTSCLVPLLPLDTTWSDGWDRLAVPQDHGKISWYPPQILPNQTQRPVREQKKEMRQMMMRYFWCWNAA